MSPTYRSATVTRVPDIDSSRSMARPPAGIGPICTNSRSPTTCESGPWTGPDEFGDDEKRLDEHRVTLDRLNAGEQFVYEFDFGDRWLHLCAVSDRRIDPFETVGIVPEHPMPYWGWG